MSVSLQGCRLLRVLIETLWNVNELVTAVRIREITVLIETLWNVNADTMKRR